MARAVPIGILFVGIGLVAGAFAMLRGRPTDLPAAPEPAAPPPSVFGRSVLGIQTGKAGGDGHPDQLERRLALLTAQLATETAERQRLQQRLDAVTAEVAALRGSAPGTGRAPSSAANAMPGAPPAIGAALQAMGDAAPSTAGGGSEVERGLVAAGVDPATVADIKHRQDGLTLEEVYLRDQATREQWLNSQRFNEEMGKIARQRVSMRDEIGDDAYDRYLAALGHPNRVAVNDVLLESPAAQAGLQTGDLVLRYGDARIFAPEELVAETHRGTPGENVRVELIRNGQTIQVDVPRGPLGINIAPVAAPALSPR